MYKVYYELSTNLIRQFKKTSVSGAVLDPNSMTNNPEKKIIVRGETLVEFKGCAIKVINGCTFKVISGDIQDLTEMTARKTQQLTLVCKGDGIYEIRKKNVLTGPNAIQGNVNAIIKFQKDNTEEPAQIVNANIRNQRNRSYVADYRTLEKSELANYLNSKPLLNTNKSYVLAKERAKRKKQNVTVTEIRKNTSNAENRFVSNSTRNRLKSHENVPEKLIVQGYFVNKIFE